LTPARPRTITETLDHVLETDGGRPALIAPSGTLSYEQLDAGANAAAASLRGLGVAPGDRVAASLPNDVDIVTAFHGAMRLGAIWVGVNRNLALPEKEVLLAAADPVIFLTEPGTATGDEGGWKVVVADPADPTSEWASAVTASAGAARLAAPDPDAPAGLAFTSGTTGEPKGIVHSQRNLLLPAASLTVSRGYDETLRKGDCLPLTILNLQVLSTLLTSAAGGTCILTDRRDARGISEWISRERINVWNGVPALLYSLVHDSGIDPQSLSSIREVWTGGAGCPEELYVEFAARFGVSLRQTYGLTEAPTVVTIEPIDGQHVPESSGGPLPHLEVVVRRDDGRDVPAGDSGEIVVRGAREGAWAGAYTTLSGYWRHGKVEPYTSDELPTGDIGAIDENGNLFVRDRKKLLILRGGANVYPNEVERELDRIAGVRASAVVGIADERLGQRVVAVIEADADFSLTPDELIEHCRTRLAGYKVPEQIRIVDILPRNAMGKVQRTPLTELFTKQ
jgi:O-succinylbenzoic acid--CoA ligase